MTKLSDYISIKLYWSVEEYAKLYLGKMVRFDGVTLAMIYNRGTQFTS